MLNNSNFIGCYKNSNSLTIGFKTGLSFKDVQKFIPNITIDNEVVTDGEILHLQICTQERQSLCSLQANISDEQLKPTTQFKTKALMAKSTKPKMSSKAKIAKTLHLFIDTKTNEYCFSSKYANNQDNCDLLYEIGDTVLAKYQLFGGDVDKLILYVVNNITAIL